MQALSWPLFSTAVVAILSATNGRVYDRIPSAGQNDPRHPAAHPLGVAANSTGLSGHSGKQGPTPTAAAPAATFASLAQRGGTDRLGGWTKPLMAMLKVGSKIVPKMARFRAGNLVISIHAPRH
jgi:hypothetical protein